MSWYLRVNRVANLYGVPNSYTVFSEPPWEKNAWKTVIKEAIRDYIENSWLEDISKLSSLQLFNPGTVALGSAHPSRRPAGLSPYTIKQAISKVRFLTDTMMNGAIAKRMFDEK